MSGPARGEKFTSVRLESDTLYDVIGVVASAPDLPQVLGGVVDVLTRATRCHACFVYLRSGERLRMRAASPVFAHLVGDVEFGIDEGLAGWVARANRPAFIRENALDDPRTNYVRELREEDFQSMVAVPISARHGEVIGVIVLHTQAPREFDDSTLNVLLHAAPLVAGAIENAQLYEDARLRVEALTALTALSQQIAAVAGREDLYRTATAGVRTLLSAAEAQLFQAEDETGHRYTLVAQDPPASAAAPRPSSTGSDLLRNDAHAAPLLDGERPIGVLAITPGGVLPPDARDLLHAVANQVAVALAKADLIERLTDENLGRAVFEAMATGAIRHAETLAQQARCDVDATHVIVHAVPASSVDPSIAWPARAEQLETRLHRVAPGTIGDVSAECVRALIPIASTAESAQRLDAALQDIASAEGVAIGRSEPRRGAAAGRDGLLEAADAARVAQALSPSGGAMAFGNLGAYRYLVHVADADGPRDPYLDAVRALASYDRDRGTQLVATLEQHLTERGGITETARTLVVHPNTLRQRLERISQITGMDLATVDQIALAMAIKLARLADASTGPN